MGKTKEKRFNGSPLSEREVQACRIMQQVCVLHKSTDVNDWCFQCSMWVMMRWNSCQRCVCMHLTHSIGCPISFCCCQPQKVGQPHFVHPDFFLILWGISHWCTANRAKRISQHAHEIRVPYLYPICFGMFCIKLRWFRDCDRFGSAVSDLKLPEAVPGLHYEWSTWLSTVLLPKHQRYQHFRAV